MTILAFSGLPARAQTQSGVQVWLTTADRSSLFKEQGKRLSFEKASTSGVRIEVQDKTRFQQMDGFGFAMTGGSAQLLMRMSAAARGALLREIFGTGDGSIGVSYLRLSIGASDMNERVFTYDDLPPGQTDPQLAHFSLGPDLADVVPVVQQVLAINPKISILASPWTAPFWMKTNHLAKAGSLLPEDYQVYAQYFVRYVQAMAAQGITIGAVTMQNEPLNPNNTPSMVVTSSEEGAFLKTALGPAFQKAGLATGIILYDHNCDRPDYPLDILADPSAAQFAVGSGFHLYAGKVEAMSEVHAAHPDKNIYFTEQMVTQDDNQKPLQIAEPTSRVVIGATRNWARNVLLWNLAADPSYGPHTNDGGCPVCQGAVTLDGNTVTRNLAFYTMAHVSRLVRPGSVRLGSDGTPGDLLPNVAFATPEHTIVLIVANPSTSPQTFSIIYHGRSFHTSLGAGDVATYIW
jgi:glucosylceramidase